ncbi:MAG: energy transducer TonB [Cytophagales bacterium]|nr:energy transducer TonB [Cytophagales bacterium]
MEVLEKKAVGAMEHLLVDRPIALHRKQKIADKTAYQDLLEIKTQKAQKEKREKLLYFFVGLSLSLFLIILAFEHKVQDDTPMIVMDGGENDIEMMAEIPLTEQPPPPPPPTQNIPQVITEVANDTEVIEDLKVEIDVEMTENMVVEEVVFEEVEIEEEKVDEIFDIVETLPEPIGGYAAFYRFLAENLDYPKDALKNRVEGKVFVQFVIEKDGGLTNFKVLKGIGSSCDEEAIRVLTTVPNWEPGKQRGRNVRVYRTIPIIFKLAN